MPTYVVLMNLTEQGVKNIKEAPERIKTAVQSLEAGGGKLIAFYTLMGPYDYLAITEVPSDEFGLAQLLSLGMAGQVRTTTYRAFSLQELSEVLNKLP